MEMTPQEISAHSLRTHLQAHGWKGVQIHKGVPNARYAHTVYVPLDGNMTGKHLAGSEGINPRERIENALWEKARRVIEFHKGTDLQIEPEESKPNQSGLARILGIKVIFRQTGK